MILKIKRGSKKWPKGVTSKYFIPKEGDCRCGCTPTLWDTKLVKLLDIVRESTGKPVYITGPYRCKKHNATVPGAAKNSRHILGQAVDIKCPGITVGQLHNLVNRVGFSGIGYYSNRAHVDTGSGANRPTYWGTKKGMGGKKIIKIKKPTMPTKPKPEADKDTSKNMIMKLERELMDCQSELADAEKDKRDLSKKITTHAESNVKLKEESEFTIKELEKQRDTARTELGEANARIITIKKDAGDAMIERDAALKELADYKKSILKTLIKKVWIALKKSRAESSQEKLR